MLHIPIYFIVIYNILVVVLVAAAAVATNTNTSDRLVTHSADTRLLFCQHCDCLVNCNAKHCRFCDKCSTNFDHHCTYLNNCIGHSNYNSFITCVVTCSAVILTQSITATVALVRTVIDIDINGDWSGVAVSYINNTTLTGVQAVVGLHALLSLIVLLPVLYLLFLHLYLYSKHFTTYEWIVRSRASIKVAPLAATAIV